MTAHCPDPWKRKPQPAIAATIVHKRAKPGRFGPAPDLEAEEQQSRGDAADTLFREPVRRAIGAS